uniref:Cyclin-K-like n=1 Tax=Sinocyclocheilus rhinocerous TaxID=307959 RepID=A0A673K3V1_9TELE
MKDGKENSTAAAGSFATNLDHTKPCWYWDKKDLAHTPSQSDGLDPATEARYRREGARFIFDVGTRLGLHYDTLATGITYFHRFYMFHSFKQFPRYVTGACCLFLAGKVEETPKKCKDIIKTARSLLNDVQFAQFGDDPKEEVMVLERILLQTIKFDLQVEHPYQFLLRYAKQLKGINRFKGIVHPKMKILSLITHPHAVPNPYEKNWHYDARALFTSRRRRIRRSAFMNARPELTQSGGQNPPAQPPSKKNSPQASPPAKIKRQHVSPKDEPKAPTEQVGSKIPRLESPMPPLPVSQPPGYNPSYPPPPPRMPPGHNVPPPVMGLPPAGYPPPPGQPQVPLPPHAMPPVAGMNRGAWMR